MEPNNEQDKNNQMPTTLAPEEVSSLDTTIELRQKPEASKNEPAQSKPKKLIILVVIFAILAAISIGFGIWGIINVNQKPTPIPVAPTNPEPIEPAVNEEVELTDNYIVKDLNEKLAALHHTNLLDSPMVTRAYEDGGNYDMIYELYNGTLSENAKIFTVYSYLKDQFKAPSIDTENTIIAKYPNNYDKTDFENGRLMVIDANTFASGYHALFGNSLNLSSINDTTLCPRHRYDDSLGLIITDVRCGGTGPNISYFYKDQYTKDNDHVYAYIDAIEIGEEGIYCGIKSGYENDPSLKCGTAPAIENIKEFDISPYRDKTGKYRFVFTKADDGTYFFVRVEKIS